MSEQQRKEIAFEDERAAAVDGRGLRLWANRRPDRPIEAAILRILDENAALRTRAEQVEARLANTKPYIRRAQELEAERDALRAEAGRLMEALNGLRNVLNEIRGDWTDPRDAIRRGWDIVGVARESAPLSAAAVERWKAIRESWMTISQLPPKLMPSIETVDGMKFWDALEKIEEALREREGTR